QQLRGAHLAEAGPGHAFSDVVLDDAIDREAARVPEHLARAFLLQIEQLEPLAEHAMIVGFHVVLRSVGRRTASPQKTEGPVRKPAGPDLPGVVRRSAHAALRRPAGAGRRRGRARLGYAAHG